MRKFLSLLAGSALTCMLSACLVPERFSAQVSVQPDGSFHYSYEGTAVDSMAAMKLKQQGILSSADQQGLAEEAQKLREEPDIQKAVYNGNARYTLEMAGQRAKGENLRLLDMFSVQTDKDGVMTVAALPLSDSEKQEFRQLGIHMKGLLKVSIPPHAEVLSQNASSIPTGNSGIYSWNLGNLKVRPEIKFRLPS